MYVCVCEHYVCAYLDLSGNGGEERAEGKLCSGSEAWNVPRFGNRLQTLNGSFSDQTEDSLWNCVVAILTALLKAVVNYCLNAHVLHVLACGLHEMFSHQIPDCRLCRTSVEQSRNKEPHQTDHIMEFSKTFRGKFGEQFYFHIQKHHRGGRLTAISCHFLCSGWK